MKEVKDSELSRRNFLTKGAMVAAGASILAISSKADAEEKNTGDDPITNDPVFTESTQTLTNKTISSRNNTLGGDDVFVKEFAPSGSDITTALNDALAYLAGIGRGGRILIPRGVWTTKGGHDFNSSVSIEGVGVTSNGPVYGTKVTFISGESNFVFRILANNQNCSLKNMEVNMENDSSAVGLLLTNQDQGSAVGTNIYFTAVENVQFWFGGYGIKVESSETKGVSDNFECIMNRFEKLSFFQCQTAFYCNSVNGGYEFNSCYFQISPKAGTALDCVFMGAMALENCLFVGVSSATAHVPASDGSTILKTFGAFNSISFHNCQDENVEFYYQNSTNYYPDVALSFKDCLIQSQFVFTASGAVIFDTCRINVTDIGSGGVRIRDTSTAFALVYQKGKNNLFWHIFPPQNTRLDDFVNDYSRLIYEANEVGLAEIAASNDTPAYFIRNATRGAVNVKSGTAYITVYNNLITTDSLVFAQLRTYDSGGARIREVQSGAGYFVIYLNQNAATDLSVAFKVENVFGI